MTAARPVGSFSVLRIEAIGWFSEAGAGMAGPDGGTYSFHRACSTGEGP